MFLALEIDGAGAHPAAWRRARPAPDQLLSPQRLRAVAQVAERAGFTAVTIDDDLLPPGRHPDPVGRIGAVERAAFVAEATSVLSVVPVVSTTHTEPFHVSTQIASIDHISAGRAGWIVGTSADPDSARAWGRPPADPVREAADSVRVVGDLWDSWEDGAVIRDVRTSRYLDRERIHYVDFAGATYSVKGPAIVPRPPQGRPVVFAPDGLLPPGLADVALVPVPGRGTAVRTVADIEVALDSPDEAAAARIKALGPWPDGARLRYIGDPAGFVRLIQDIAGVVDGVRIHPLVLDEELATLSAYVIPALVIAGTFSRPLPATTLRSRLGLSRPESRFARGAAR
jgi:luciferase-like monooxygenase